jgi:hypothetical protein
MRQSAGRGRFASTLPAGYHSSRSDNPAVRNHKVEPSAPAQRDATACQFEVLERLELGVAGR